MFITMLCSVVKVCEQSVVSIDRWINKDAVYMHNRILFSHNNEWNPGICDNMDGPWRYYIMLSKMSDKDKYHMILYIHGI